MRLMIVYNIAFRSLVCVVNLCFTAQGREQQSQDFNGKRGDGDGHNSEEEREERRKEFKEVGMHSATVRVALRRALC